MDEWPNFEDLRPMILKKWHVWLVDGRQVNTHCIDTLLLVVVYQRPKSFVVGVCCLKEAERLLINLFFNHG